MEEKEAKFKNIKIKISKTRHESKSRERKINTSKIYFSKKTGYQFII